MDHTAIVIDTDWASEALMSAVADELLANKVRATWFVTNDNTVVRSLMSMPDFFEVGIHPNFNAGSTQGTDPRNVIERLLTIVPDAKSVRTHTLMQSTPLLKMLREDFGILHDASLLLPKAAHLVPHDLYFAEDSSLLRLPSFWEDDVEMSDPKKSFSWSDGAHHVAGLKLYAFHPIHIVLNSRSSSAYQRCRTAVDITKCSVDQVRAHAEVGVDGTGTFFSQLLRTMSVPKGPSGSTVAQLAAEWRSSS